MAEVSITVFTPTYNRGKYLRRLHDSLKAQSQYLTEWLVVDDGSDDNTAAIMEELIKEAAVSIAYFYQENGGKHRAINRGVQLAKGDLFFIVDSDDYLPVGSLSEVSRRWAAVCQQRDADRYAGLCGLRADSQGTVIGGKVDYEELDATIIEYRYVRGYHGDKAEIYRTEVLRRFPFPEIDGEKFCTEAMVWNRIAIHPYLLRFFNETIYICEYLPGGLSAKSFMLRRDSPQSAMLYYAEFLNIRVVSWKYRVRAAINYWRFAVYDQKHTFTEKRKLIRQRWTLVFLPVACCLSIVDRINAKS
jgi:Glycosyltransferases involved in cell wall biogenesis